MLRTQPKKGRNTYGKGGKGEIELLGESAERICLGSHGRDTDCRAQDVAAPLERQAACLEVLEGCGDEGWLIARAQTHQHASTDKLQDAVVQGHVVRLSPGRMDQHAKAVAGAIALSTQLCIRRSE
jgi:hypothetical protein